MFTHEPYYYCYENILRQCIIIHPSFQTYPFLKTMLIHDHIGTLVEVSMGYAADKVLVVEHSSLMQQCR
jgi:hypothetical protein